MMNQVELMKCCISRTDQIDDLTRQIVRERVCANDEPIQAFEGNDYCLFHLPSDNKDIVKFEKIFNQRLAEVAKAFDETKSLSATEQKKAREKLSYNFRSVWFPSKIYFRDFEFRVKANFACATFSEIATFSGATFQAGAKFVSANFKGQASFDGATFLAKAEFSGCKFNGSTRFDGADFEDIVSFYKSSFLIDAYFQSARFNRDCSFDLSEFCGRVDFSGNSFLGDFSCTSSRLGSYTLFEKCRFRKEADFADTVFRGTASFQKSRFSGSTTFIASVFEGSAAFNKARFYSEAYFDEVNFKELASFDRAVFLEATVFKDSELGGTCSFAQTIFGKKSVPDFSHSRFLSDSYFDETCFGSPVDFNSSIFGRDSDMLFRDTTLTSFANFRYCTAYGYVRYSNLFLRGEFSIDFTEASFENSVRVSFNSMPLRPFWFLNVDPRKFVFINIHDGFSNAILPDELSKAAMREPNGNEKRLFEITARQLAINAEENNRYEDAAKFRYMAMETRRLQSDGFFRRSISLNSLYKWSSGYGERSGWATIVLASIIVFFAILYNSRWATFVDGDSKAAIAVASSSDQAVKMNFLDGFIYSFHVATLQKPDPKPQDNFTRSIVLLETIVAPLQAALLALAIRRKFMR